MKTHLILPIACLLSGSLLTSCSEPGDATEKTTEQLQENKKEMAEAKTDNTEEWREERAEAARELRELREDLVSKKEREQKRLADGIKDATKKAECEARIVELDKNIARVDASLMNVDANTGTAWTETKAEARKTVDETKGWIAREAEKVDWKTDADADKDGH